MSSAAYPVNQFAPSYFQGVNTPPSAQVLYEDRPYEYVYNPPNGELTANQVIAQDSVSIQTDADFICFGWYLSAYTGLFQIQLTDSNGYQLQSGFVVSTAIAQTSANPTVFSPSHFFPAGGKIQIAIADLSGQDNPLQIVFKGVKRYRINQGS